MQRGKTRTLDGIAHGTEPNFRDHRYRAYDRRPDSGCRSARYAPVLVPVGSCRRIRALRGGLGGATSPQAHATSANCSAEQCRLTAGC